LVGRRESFRPQALSGLAPRATPHLPTLCRLERISPTHRTPGVESASLSSCLSEAPEWDPPGEDSESRHSASFRPPLEYTPEDQCDIRVTFLPICGFYKKSINKKKPCFQGFPLSGRRGSNPRPSAWEKQAEAHQKVKFCFTSADRNPGYWPASGLLPSFCGSWEMDNMNVPSAVPLLHDLLIELLHSDLRFGLPLLCVEEMAVDLMGGCGRRMTHLVGNVIN
jgi:hypothetical protein